VIPSKTSPSVGQDALLDQVNQGEREAKADPSGGRVMLIDGTSVIYRAYYKLLGMSCYTC